MGERGNAAARLIAAARARDLARVEFERVLADAITAGDLTIASAARALGVTRQAVHAMVTRIRAGG